MALLLPPDSELALIPSSNQYALTQLGADVRIGGDGDMFIPEVRASRWGNECWASLRHLDVSRVQPHHQPIEIIRPADGIIAVDRAGLELDLNGRTHQYIPTPGVRGLMEWDIIYETADDLPANGIERFSLEGSSGLTWCIQPPLTPEEIDLGFTRPDNVIGSYTACFNKRNNKYGTGKHLHLYRPVMIAADGVRLSLVQLIVGGEVLITLPDAAWFQAHPGPWVLDPTLGYDTVGASSIGRNTYLYSSSGTTDGTGGDVVSYHCAIAIRGTGDPGVKMGIYTETAAEPAALLEQVEFDVVASDDENTPSVTTPTLAPSTRYWVAFIAETNYQTHIAYDTVAATADYGEKLTTYGAELSDPHGVRTPQNVAYSIWVTYAEAAPSFSPYWIPRNYNILGGGL